MLERRRDALFQQLESDDDEDDEDGEHKGDADDVALIWQDEPTEAPRRPQWRARILAGHVVVLARAAAGSPHLSISYTTSNVRS